jgi:hypothetical protein
MDGRVDYPVGIEEGGIGGMGMSWDFISFALPSNSN